MDYCTNFPSSGTRQNVLAAASQASAAPTRRIRRRFGRLGRPAGHAVRVQEPRPAEVRAFVPEEGIVVPVALSLSAGAALGNPIEKPEGRARRA